VAHPILLAPGRLRKLGEPAKGFLPQARAQNRTFVTSISHRSVLAQDKSPATEKPLNWLLGPFFPLCRQRCRPIHDGNAIPNGFPYFLQGAHLDLPHPLPRDAEFFGKLLERDRLIDKTPPFEDAPLAGAEHGQRLPQRLATILGFLALGELRLLADAVIGEPILPFAGIAFLTDRRVERGVT
jgi:hypothetical protein